MIQKQVSTYVQCLNLTSLQLNPQKLQKICKQLVSSLVIFSLLWIDIANAMEVGEDHKRERLTRSNPLYHPLEDQHNQEAADDLPLLTKEAESVPGLVIESKDLLTHSLSLLGTLPGSDDSTETGDSSPRDEKSSSDEKGSPHSSISTSSSPSSPSTSSTEGSTSPRKSDDSEEEIEEGFPGDRKPWKDLPPGATVELRDMRSQIVSENPSVGTDSGNSGKEIEVTPFVGAESWDGGLSRGAYATEQLDDFVGGRIGKGGEHKNTESQEPLLPNRFEEEAFEEEGIELSEIPLSKMKEYLLRNYAPEENQLEESQNFSGDDKNIIQISIAHEKSLGKNYRISLPR